MKTINAKYIKKDKCRVPRDRLVECVKYLRYGQSPAHANLSNIWHSKPKIAKMLGVSNHEVNHILKEELSPSL